MNEIIEPVKPPWMELDQRIATAENKALATQMFGVSEFRVAGRYASVPDLIIGLFLGVGSNALWDTLKRAVGGVVEFARRTKVAELPGTLGVVSIELGNIRFEFRQPVALVVSEDEWDRVLAAARAWKLDSDARRVSIDFGRKRISAYDDTNIFIEQLHWPEPGQSMLPPKVTPPTE